MLDYYSTATLDTGTSLMLAPIELYYTIESMLLNGKLVTKDLQGNVYSSCKLDEY
jgi:hypothetical protein